MNGYVSLYDGKRFELHAATLYAAKLAAVEHFKPPKKKEHMLVVMLAEKDGRPVTHTAED